jgi:uncharacterized protein
MKESILGALGALEAETGLRALYACESGSRAWGFASRDSDWDVRFVFAWPRDAYLRVQAPSTTLTRQLPGDLDISGWDLRMALSQFAKSNASFLEWLGSPMVYRQESRFMQALDALRPRYFQPRAALRHYLGQARSLWPDETGEAEALNGKKCLYVLRAVLAAQWVAEARTPPPVPFAELMPLVTDPDLRREIDALLRVKAAGSERDAFPVSPALRGLVAERRAALEPLAADLEAPAVEMALLDELFRSTLDRLEDSGCDDA